jgi:hypothetical protein
MNVSTSAGFKRGERPTGLDGTSGENYRLFMKAKKKPTLNDAMIGEVTDIFCAMGDKSRLRILRALLDAGGPQSQSEMLGRPGFPRPTSASTSRAWSAWAWWPGSPGGSDKE